MGSACYGGGCNEAEASMFILEAILNFKMGERVGSRRVDRSFKMNAGICDFPLADDWGIDGKCVFSRMAGHKGEIGLLNLSLLHGNGGPAGSGGGFGNKHNSAGLAVEAVD